MKRILVVLEGRGFHRASFSPSALVRSLLYRDLFQKHGYEVRYINRSFPPALGVFEGYAHTSLNVGGVTRYFPTAVRFFVAAPLVLLRLIVRSFSFLFTLVLRGAAFLNDDFIIRAAKRYDVVQLNKVSSERFIRKLRGKTKARLVLDVGDALWLPRYRNSEFTRILPLVDRVATDNEHTAAHLRRFNEHCVVIPDSPQLESFEPRRSLSKRKKGDSITLGWIGSRGTAFSLYVIWEVLERLFAKHSNLHLRLLGADADSGVLPPFETVRFSALPFYSQSQMIDEALAMDIGLFPLHNVQSSLTRGVLKATIYMSAEVAVVCSPVGQCLDLIQDGANGMLAATTEEWEQQLERLITDKELRDRIASAGLATVRSDFTLERCFSRLQAALGD